MTKKLIVYCHPYAGSFNHAILEKVLGDLKSAGQEYLLIDLYQDQFNPSYTTEELSLFKTGATCDPLVTKYQQMIRQADQILLITPIWWNDLPAMLKGFFDKVMKMTFAYQVTETGVKGLLDNISSLTIITTATSPTWYLKYVCGNPIGKVFLRATVKQLGIKKRKWLGFGGVTKSTADQRTAMLKKLTIEKLFPN